MTAGSVRGSGRAGPAAQTSKLPVPEVVATNVLSDAAVPSEPPTYRIVVPDWTTAPSVRGCGQGDLVRRRRPRHDRAERRRAGQRLVAVRAEVERAPGEDPEIDRLVDGEVVGPVGDVAEHEDEQDEPERGLERRPAPAAARRAGRRTPVRASWRRPGVQGLLRHRPPSRPGPAARLVAYLTSRVPFIVVGWTWQMNVYVPALRAGTAYCRVAGPVKNAVSPIATAAPPGSLMTTLCGPVCVCCRTPG